MWRRRKVEIPSPDLGVAFCCARKAGAVNKRQKNRRRQSFLFISLRIKDAGSGCCAIV
ncbi:hypothetical protein M128_3603 [Bacteroides fragilis str. S6L8]|nr:hypothetical protein M128_3603 [Bacteroides fragilis str. S6L8]